MKWIDTPMTRAVSVLVIMLALGVLLAAVAFAGAPEHIASPDTDGWMITDPGWDPPHDKQTGGFSVSQDIVGDFDAQTGLGTPSAYLHFGDDGEEIAVRVRVNNADSGMTFKNFVYMGLDVTGDAAVDFFIGTYNPTGNGRVAVYLADNSLANTGPGNTSIPGPIASFQPRDGQNYSFIPAVYELDDPRYPGFSEDPDYFITFRLTLADINAALTRVGRPDLVLTPTTPFTYTIGTAKQDNALNADVNGLDGLSGTQSWPFPPPISTDGSRYHVVHFDRNGGDRNATPSSLSVKDGETISELPGSPQRRGGWRFVGWSYEQLADNATMSDQFDITAPINEDLRVYALWVEDKTEERPDDEWVFFDPVGGSWAQGETYQHVRSLDGRIQDMPDDPTPPTTPYPGSNRAYYFGGWVTQSRFYNFTASGNIPFNNIINYQGNVDIVLPIEFFTGTTSVHKLSRVMQPQTGQEELTAYALWFVADSRPTHKPPQLSFYDNIFDNDPTSALPSAPGTLLYQSFVSNNNKPAFSPVSPTRPGFVFRGWDTNPGADPAAGGSTRYLDPYNPLTTDTAWREATFYSATDFFAMWEPAYYGMVFDANTIDTNGDHLAHTAMLTLEYTEKLNPLTTHGFIYPALPEALLSGYTLLGWNTDPEGFGFWANPTFDANRFISVGGDMRFTLVTETTAGEPRLIEDRPVAGYTTLYAIWERQPAESVRVTFDAMGGFFDETEDGALIERMSWMTDDGRINASDYAIPTKIHPNGTFSLFLGWSFSDTEDRTVDFTHPSLEIFKEESTVYAVWSDPIEPLAVTFWPNSGEWPSASMFSDDPFAPITVETDGFGVIRFVPFSDETVGPVRDGFVFMGWNTKPDGTGKWFFADSPVDRKLDVYAQWRSADSDYAAVTFLTNDGSTGPGAVFGEPVLARIGQTTSEPSTRPDKGSEWIFKGWYKDAAGLEAWDFETDTIQDDPTYLYGNWDVAVTFDYNGALMPAMTEFVNRGSAVSQPSDPTRDGHLFIGWSLDPGQYIEWDFTNNRILEPTTLYAMWEAKHTFSALVQLKLDNAAWSGRDVSLQLDEQIITLTETDDGLYRGEDVAVGTYAIRVDGVTTGRTITIEDGSALVTLDYYTVDLKTSAGIDAVEGAGIYLSETEVPITASVISGWSWSHWIDRIDASTTLASREATLTVTAPRALTAVATKDTYQVTVEVTRDEQPWDHLEMTLVAEDESSHALVWTESGVYVGEGIEPGTYRIHRNGDDTTRTITIDADNASTVIAYYTLTLQYSDGITSVQALPLGVEGDGDLYLAGSEVSISAQVRAGWDWSHWSDLLTDGPTILWPTTAVTMDRTRTLQANAVPKTFPATITINLDGEAWSDRTVTVTRDGSVFHTMAEGEYGHYSVEKLVAATYAIHLDGEDTGRTITITDAPAAMTLDYYSLILNAGAGVESVIGTGRYLFGSTVDISAVVEDGWTWDRWINHTDEGEDIDERETTITMTAPLSLTADATLDTFEAVVGVNLDGVSWEGRSIALTLNGEAFIPLHEIDRGIYGANDIAPGTYRIFKDDLDTTRTLTIEQANASQTLDYYTLSLASGQGISSVSGAGIYLAGTEVAISAQLQTGHAWYRWINHTIQGANKAEQEATVTVTSTLSLTANATLITFEATVAINLDQGRWTDRAVSLRAGAMTPLTLSEQSAGVYTASGVAPGTYAIFIDGQDTERTLVVTTTDAQVTLDYFRLRLNTGAGIEDVSGEGIYLSGTSVAIDAVVEPGWSWDRWIAIASGSDIDARQTTVVLSSPITLTANATLDTYEVAVAVNLDYEAWSSQELALSIEETATTRFAPRASDALIPLQETKPGIYVAEELLPGDYHIIKNGDQTGVGLTVVDEPVSATLDFFTKTIIAGPGIASEPSSGIYLVGTEIEIVAEVLPGWQWEGWLLPDVEEIVIEEPQTTIVIVAPTVLVKLASPITNEVTVQVNLDGRGWEDQVIALSADGVTFIALTTTEDGRYQASDVAAGTYAIYKDGIDTGQTVTITEDDATTTLEYYQVTLSAGAGIDAVSGAGIYLLGTHVAIDAVVSEGWVWDRWIYNIAAGDDITVRDATLIVSATTSLTATAVRADQNDAPPSRETTPTAPPASREATPTPVHPGATTGDWTSLWGLVILLLISLGILGLGARSRIDEDRQP